MQQELKNKQLKALVVLFKAHASVSALVKKSLDGQDLTLNEFMVLEVLYFKGPQTTQAVVDAVLIPNSSLTHVLGCLEKKDYLLKLKDPQDRRIQTLHLTSEGTQFIESLYSHHYETLAPAFDVLDDNEQKTLISLLKRVGIEAERIKNEEN